MIPVDPQIARSELLRLFNHAEVYLLLGAAITTIGLLAGFFSLFRRRFDPMLLWFALFAILYGVRLDMRYQLFRELDVQAPIFRRVLAAIGFLVPIPAFFFFRTMNLLGRTGRLVAAAVWPVGLCLSLATLLFSPREIFFTLNSAFINVALIIVVIALLRGEHATPELALVRRGLLVFIVFALVDNLLDFFGHYHDIEPFGFVILLACLGVAAMRRVLAGEQQWTAVQRELEIARQMQLSILPAAFPESRSFRVAARYLPMTSVAGDFYDFFVASDHEAGLFIADVSGHGVSAALIASMVKIAATVERVNAASPAELLLGMNTSLFGNTQSQFVTASYVYLNARSRELRYAAAGHPPMLLLRHGVVTEIIENGLMLAAFDFATYTALALPLESGDRLVLYTDGVLEAMSASSEEFGPERLSALVRETAHLPYAEAADSIVAGVQRWAAAQNDDLTVLLCDFVA